MSSEEEKLRELIRAEVKNALNQYTFEMVDTQRYAHVSFRMGETGETWRGIIYPVENEDFTDGFAKEWEKKT